MNKINASLLLILATALMVFACTLPSPGSDQSTPSVVVKLLISVPTEYRSGPGPEYDVEGILNPGQEVDVVGRSENDAYLLILDPSNPTVYGWIKNEFPTLADEFLELPVAAPPPATSAVDATDVAGGCPTPVGGGPAPVSCDENAITQPGSGCPTPVGGGPTPVSCDGNIAQPSTGCPTPVGGGPTPVSCDGNVVQPSTGCPTPVGGGPTPVSCDGNVVQPSTGCPTPVGGGPTPVSCDGNVAQPSSGCPTPVGGGPTPVSCSGSGSSGSSSGAPTPVGGGNNSGNNPTPVGGGTNPTPVVVPTPVP